MAKDFQVSAGVTAIRRAPRDDAMMDSQLLGGEVFSVEEEADGWARGVSRHDGYEGYVDMAALSAPVLIPTHRVSAMRTYVFSEPDLKSPPRFLVSLNAKIAAGKREGKFTESQRQGWIFTGHLSPLAATEPDWVAVAERFLHSPYLWGGKESLGLDCSGLVQMSLEAAGTRIPRDSGDQEAWARARWSAVPVSDLYSGLQRGDLVFWPGHVGIMTDAVQLLHANAFHMATALEPLALAARRIAHNHAPVSGIFRAAGAIA